MTGNDKLCIATHGKNAIPDTGYPQFRWLVLLAMILVTATSDIMMISPAPLMGVIAESFNMSLGDATGYFMGLFNLVVAVSCLAGGIICDRTGLMPVLVYCSLSLTLPTIALPFFGHTFEGFLSIRIIQATGTGAILSSVSPVAALWFPFKDRGIVTGMQGVAVSLGIATGFVGAPALHSTLGNWQSSIAWLGIGCLLSVAVVFFVALGPKPAVPSKRISDSGENHAGNDDFKLAIKHPTTWIGVLIAFCLMWVLNAFNDLTPAYLAITSPVGLGFGPLSAGKMMMALEIASMAGAAATGFVMVRIFKGKIRPVIAIGFLMFAICTISVTFTIIHSTVRLITICLIVAGFFRAWVMPNAMAFVAMHYPAHITGKIVGMWIGLGIFGSSAGVICGALALRSTGNYHLSIIIVSAISLIGLALSLFLKPLKIFDHQLNTNFVCDVAQLLENTHSKVIQQTSRAKDMS